MIGIYKITNKVNGKIYIGQSVDIERRFREHKRRNEQQIDMAIQKYGIENFDLEIVEECSIEDLNAREEYWTLEYNSIVPNGYNLGVVKSLSHGENNGMAILSDEDIRIIRDCYRNKTFSSAAELARQLYPQRSSEYISEVFYGKRRTSVSMEVYTPELEEYYRYNYLHSGPKKPGEDNPASILKEKDVIKMRALYTIKKRSDIFPYFPEYKERTIISILSGQNWKHLPIYQKQNKIWVFPSTWSSEQKVEFLNKVKEITNECV